MAADVYRYFSPDYDFEPRPDRAPVQRVAIMAESFLPRFDGVSHTVYMTLRYLAQSGREVLIFAPDDAPDRVGQARVIRLPSFGLQQYPDLRLGLPVNAVTRELQEFQPDLIHCFAPAAFSLQAIRYAIRKQIPVLSNFQTDIPYYLKYYHLGYLRNPIRRWMKFLHNHTTLTFAPSTATLNELAYHGFSNLRLWMHGVDEVRFHPAHRATEWRDRLLHGRSPDSVIALYVGRLAKEKNLSALIDLARTPGVALTIVGGGPGRAEIEQALSGLNVHFVGTLKGQDLACAYAAADLFVFPSLSETFGLVVLEAMSSGLPVVVRDHGGVLDIVQDGQSGFITTSEDQFTRRARQLATDPALRARMSELARARAEQFTYRAVMAQLEDYYREALSTPLRSTGVITGRPTRSDPRE